VSFVFPNSIQFQINGTTVFSFIPQLHFQGIGIHLAGFVVESSVVHAVVDGKSSQYFHQIESNTNFQSHVSVSADLLKQHF
jgi:hypothetical protein